MVELNPFFVVVSVSSACSWIVEIDYTEFKQEYVELKWKEEDINWSTWYLEFITYLHR